MRLQSARQQAVAALAAAFALAVLLRFFPPSRYPYYPPCPFHTLLGILCPGCGGTRALAALLAGRWVEAARQNLLAVAFAPALAAAAALELHSALRWNRWRKLPVSPLAVKCLLTIALLFGFARNMAPLLQGFRGFR